MQIPCPSIADLRRADESLGIGVSDVELEAYQPYLAEFVKLIDEVDRVANAPPVRYPRSSGYRPGPDENPLNAWYWKCDIRGAETGPLAGRRVAIKDAICVAGVPMMNGSFLVEGYTPEFDATVVSRILDAGGEIAGKAVCEDLARPATVTRPRPAWCAIPTIRPAARADHQAAARPSWLPASATWRSAATRAGRLNPEFDVRCLWTEADVRIGPWYTGAMPLDMTLDHLGPMAQSARDVATLLDAIAGYDERAPAPAPRRGQA